MKKFINRGVIFFALVGVVFLWPASVSAASIFLSPAKGNYNVGDKISFRIMVSGDTSMNAVSGVLAVPPGQLVVESISKTGSSLNFWAAEPTYSKSTGVMKFEGVSLSGFTGNSNPILFVTLRALKEGPANITFQTGQVLANDGQGTSIPSSLSGASFLINKAIPVVKAPVIPAATTTFSNVPPPLPILFDVPATPPEIIAKEIGGKLVISGVSKYPKANTNVTFVSAKNSKIFASTLTDDKGNFSVEVPDVLKNGPYAVNATILLEGGQKSVQSNMVAIEIGYPLYLNITWEMVTYLGVTLMGLILLFVAGVIWHGRRRDTVPPVFA